MSKTKTMYIVAIGIFLAIFNIIAFVIPFNFDGNFWTGYSFGMIAILLTAGIVYYVFDKPTLKSKFYGIPLIYMVKWYFIVQLILALIQMCLSFVPFNIPFQIGLVVNIILLAYCILGLFTVEISKDEIERIDQKVKEKVFYIKSLQTDVETLIDKTADDATKKSLKDLAETIKYSDPMSSPQLASLENKIESKVSILCDSNDPEQIKTLCDELQQLFAERNRKCKLLK